MLGLCFILFILEKLQVWHLFNVFKNTQYPEQHLISDINLDTQEKKSESKLYQLKYVARNIKVEQIFFYFRRTKEHYRRACDAAAVSAQTPPQEAG